MNFTTISAELNNLGADLHEFNKVDEAEALFRDALRIMTKISADKGRFLLADVEAQMYYCECQLLLEQKRYMVQSIKGGDINLAGDKGGQISRNGFSSYHDAKLFTDDNRDIPSFSEPLKIDITKEALLGDDILSIVLVYNFAIVKVQRGEQQIPIELLHLVLSVMPDEVEARSTTAIACMATYHNLALLYYQQGQERHAMQMFTAAIQVGKQTLGDHVLVAGTLTTVAHILTTTGHLLDALEVYYEASQIVDRHTVMTVTKIIDSRGGRDGAAKAA